MRPFKFASLFALVATASLAIVIGSGSASARASQGLEVTRNDVTAATQDKRAAFVVPFEPVGTEEIKKRIQCKRCSCYNPDCKEACRSCQPHPKATMLERVDLAKAEQDEVQAFAIRDAAAAEIQERACKRCDCANADCYYSCRTCQPPPKSTTFERDDVAVPAFAREEAQASTPRALTIKQTRAHDGMADRVNPRAGLGEVKTGITARASTQGVRALDVPLDGDEEH